MTTASDRLRQIVQPVGAGIKFSGDLIVILLLMLAAGGVMSSVLLSRDFLVGTELKNASSSAAVENLSKQRERFDRATVFWTDAIENQQSRLGEAISRQPEIALRASQLNSRMQRTIEQYAAPNTPTLVNATGTGAGPLIKLCRTQPGVCAGDTSIQILIDEMISVEDYQKSLEGEIVARRQAVRDMEAEVVALRTSSQFPDATWLTKREVRYALDQWKAYQSNPVLRPLVVFASAPIFILNLTLCALMGGAGASIAYLLVRIDPALGRPNLAVTLLLGALAAATLFLMYSAGLGIITASSSASLTFPDPLFVTGISLIAGFNASGMMAALSSFASKILPKPADTPTSRSIGGGQGDTPLA